MAFWIMIGYLQETNREKVDCSNLLGSRKRPWPKETSLRDPETPRINTAMFPSSEMKNLLMGYMAKRRVFRTSNGRMGLADLNTQGKDCLALVEGICVLVILRPSETKQ